MKRDSLSFFGSISSIASLFLAIIGLGLGIYSTLKDDFIVAILAFSGTIFVIGFVIFAFFKKRNRSSLPAMPAPNSDASVLTIESFTPTEQDWVSDPTDSNNENFSFSIATSDASVEQKWSIESFNTYDLAKGKIKIEKHITPLNFPCAFKTFPSPKVTILGLDKNVYSIDNNSPVSCHVRVDHKMYYNTYECIIEGNIEKPKSNSSPDPSQHFPN